jgi:hypothetical protein
MASLKAADCSAAASANTTSANASGPLVCQTIVRRNGWRSPKARPNIMKMTQCATSAQITAMSSTATPESHGGAQNNASRTEDNIDAPSAMSCGHVVRPRHAAKNRVRNRVKMGARATHATGPAAWTSRNDGGMNAPLSRIHLASR